MSRIAFATAIACGLLCTATSRAGDLDIGVIVSGEITPGVYGQVMIGSRPPPLLVYAQPVLVEVAPHAARPAPVYLHVPPGHARRWARHCREYHACNRPVYFVRSAEYDRDDEDRGHRGKPDRGRRGD
jgi:hypothetical protein